ncbi:NAD(P)H-quinone oxidoreductase [Alteromonas ponticola]|uniref:NAD(P)H-quinone oxidoreductase n=1 Tax=Alteromonas ponticola TaxID=2720613 RepID=A0ABX1QYY9_9ALTE|nr:NAD(P)H-quinone oxidoreductase [Alteromonas ponticola]NMH58718.1 NAD(P)H-quinone oxidoreductase [Alteromonas ponticola]
MKFINFKQGGEPEDLYQDECSTPEVNPHQIRIQVQAFGVNRADTLQRLGKYPPPPGESAILGLEVAGIVDAVGSQVTQWQKGERVFALVPGGGYAKQVVVNADHVMPIPGDLSMVEAAGIAEVFLTAYQSLFLVAKLQRDAHILVHAGASGVGLAATQLASFSGARIACTASSKQKLELCKSMGADVLINYQEQDFAEQIQQHFRGGVDMVLDFIGGDYINRNLTVLAQDGIVVYLAMLAGRFADKLDMGLMLNKRATLTASTLRNRSDDYKAHLIAEFSHHCLDAFAERKLVANIDTVYAIDDIAIAHQRLHDNDSQGKLIIKW